MLEMQQRQETISGEKQYLFSVDLIVRQENGEDQI